jgi:hypothetical protein
MEAHMSDDEFIFPVDRGALTPERWNALKTSAVRRAHMERSVAIRETMTRLVARLRSLRTLSAFRVVDSPRPAPPPAPSSRQAVARVHAPHGQAKRI